MNKRCYLIIILILLLLTGCESSNNQETNNNQEANTVSNIKDISGTYQAIVMYESNDELKEYRYYTKEITFKLSDDNTCSYRLSDDLAKLLTGNELSEACTWEYNNEDLNIKYTTHKKEFSFKTQIENDSFFIETEVVDENFDWRFNTVNIKGIKFIKLDKEEMNYFTDFLTGKVYDINPNINTSSDDIPSRWIVERNKINSKDELLTIKKNGIKYTIDGDVDFNTPDLYPIKITFYDSNGHIIKIINKVISVLPTQAEMADWYYKYFHYSTVINNPRDDPDNYYNVYGDGTKTLCIRIDNPYFAFLILKNGYKCEDFYKTMDYNFFGEYKELMLPRGRFVYYDDITDKTDTIGNMYNFFKDYRSKGLDYTY